MALLPPLRWTEVVLLRGGAREASFVTQSTQLLRCGRQPFLRPCTLADAAVRMQGPGCIRSMAKHPTMMRVLRQSNCTDVLASLGVCGAAEAIADREVARLRSAPAWQTTGPVDLSGW